MVKAGHVGHDGSFIRLGGIDDICGIDREERSKVKGREAERMMTMNAGHSVCFMFALVKL